MSSLVLLLTAMVGCRKVLSNGKVPHIPRFRDYPVKQIYRGKTKRPNFGNWASNRRLRAWLGPERPKSDHFPWKWEMDDVIHRKVDFAGHYILVNGSAGGNGAMFNVVDAKTGFVYPFPYDLKVVSSWQYNHEADHRKGSRIAIFHGYLFDESGERPDLPFGDHYFLFANHNFAYLGSVLMVKPDKKLDPRVRILAIYRNSSSRTLTGTSGKHSFVVTLTSRKFRPDAHKITKNESGAVEIDGKSWDSDTEDLPATELAKFEVLVDGKRWSIPANIWKDCFNPNLGECPGGDDRPDYRMLSVRLSPDGSLLKVTMRGQSSRSGYGYSEYQVQWGLNKRGDDFEKLDDE